MDREDKKEQIKDVEPRAGEGVRSLQTWQRLAAARQALSAEPGAHDELANDPAAYFQRFGVDGTGANGRTNLTDLERQLGVAANAPPQLELRSEARRGCAAVAVVWAGAVAVNVAGVANVAVATNGGVAANVVTVVNVSTNTNTNWNWASGSD